MDYQSPPEWQPPYAACEQVRIGGAAMLVRMIRKSVPERERATIV